MNGDKVPHPPRADFDPELSVADFAQARYPDISDDNPLFNR
jgi:hypothetical protein